ncbi:MAG: CapA family protein [Ignavibacteriaceae bacterium]|nr:CapA family protein [Ignavibacteriaceae bacterium]
MANNHHFLSALAVCAVGTAIVTGVLAYPDGDTGASLASAVAPPKAAPHEVESKVESPKPVSSAVEGSKVEGAPITLFFVGDMMFDRTVKTRTQKAKDANYPFLKIGNLKNNALGAFDLVVGNLEGSISTRRAPVKSIDFAFGTEIIPVLKKAGFAAVSQANNHALDQGRQGAQDSRAVLEKAGLKVFGDQVRDDPSSALAFIDVKGKKIAFIGFNVTDNPLDKEEALNALALARDTADFIIVMPHWGQEYKEKPDAAQTGLAHWLIENGADAVVGSHPHWMESVEVYRGKPVVYSLGNFIFDQDWSRETGLGLALGLKVADKNIRLDFYPIKITASQPQFLSGSEKAARLERLAGISASSLSNQLRSGRLELAR